jgi:hypothetical protein
MIHSKVKFKVFGLCALVLGLTAINVNIAQAENTGGSWTYKLGGVLNTFAGSLHEPTLGGEIDGTHGVLLTKIAGLKVEFLCKKFTVNEGKLQLEGKVLGALTFHECITKINEATQAACEPVAEKVSKGLIKTLKIKGQMLLHKLADGTIHKILVAEPDETTAFAHIEMGPECAIGTNVLVFGKFAIQDSEPTTHLIKHLIKEFAPLTHLWVISLTAEHKATIDGAAWVFLTGAHVGFEWAGLWN